jgi:NADH dehydrogenase [ubiquinone] 1 alpha subcomplex assembly factor 3
VHGGCVFADGRALLWDVDPPKGNGSEGLAKAWEGWSEERFRVFETLVPRPGE